MTRLTAFVSSHSMLRNTDGVDYQQLACEVAAELEVAASSMDAHAPSTDLERRCLDSVRGSDILILIVGWRYGQLYDGTRSLTEIEWRTAEDSDKEVIALLLDTLPPADIPAEEFERARAFRAQFDRPGRRPLYRTFRDRQEFKRQLRAALSQVKDDALFRVVTRTSPEVGDALTKLLKVWRRDDERWVAVGGTLTTWQQMSPLVHVEDYLLEEFQLQLGDPKEVESVLPSAREVLADHQRVIVYGDFGGGKTAFLRALRLLTAERLVRQDHRARVPLLLKLGEWNLATHSFRAFVDAKAVQELGHRVAGNDLLLLLDEVDNREQPLDQASIAEIREWIEARPRAWVVIAVRQIDGFARTFFQGTPELGFVRLALHRLEPAQRLEFVEKNAPTAAARTKLLGLIADAERTQDEDVLDILRSPFTLTVLVLAAMHDEPFPRNAARVLRRHIKTAYRKPVVGLTAPGEASAERFISYIGDLAIRALGRPQREQFGAAERIYYDRIAELVMIFSRSENGTGRSWTGRYLGYFAAETLAAKPDLLADFHRHAEYGDHGRVSGRLDAALHDLIQLAPDRFDELAACDPCLAAECVVHVPAADRGVAAAHCLSLLTVMLASDRDVVHHSVVRAIAMLGVDTVPLLAQALRGQDEWYLRSRLLSAISRLSTQSATHLVLRALQDRHKRVRYAAERIVVSFDDERRAHTVAFVEQFRDAAVNDDDHDLLRHLAALDPVFQPHVDAILGEEPAPEPTETEAQTVAPIAEAGTADEDGWTGQDLLEQLVASQADPNVAARCRRWLMYSPYQDRWWGRVWTRLWDTRPDDELQRLGREWLREVPMTAGPWSHVWTRLVVRCPDDHWLIEHGRKWLDDQYPPGIGWPYVWRSVFAAAAGPELSAQGMRWLQSGSPASAQPWGLVWVSLYKAAEVDPAGAAQREQLESLALVLLRNTPIEAGSWGYVLPALCRSPRRREACELGRGWVESASPDSAGWRYVFPAIWRSGWRDPRLGAIARDWLTQMSRTHPSWWYVWEAMFERDHQDRDLFAMGLDCLEQMSAGDRGWPRVWEGLWRADFERGRLEQRARTWLATGRAALDDRGWPRVYSAVFSETALDETMFARALEFLARPWRHGWATVWLATWNGTRHLPARLRGEPATTLASLAQQWLSDAGERDPFGLVWEQLYLNRRDDALRPLALARAARHPTDPTIREVWAQLASAFPADREVREAGIQLLRVGVSGEQKHWAAIWLDVWATGGSPELRTLGRTWLASQAGRDVKWPDVWKTIWNDEGRSDQLIEAGVEGLIRQMQPHVPKRNRTNQSWRDIWPILWAMGSRRNDFIAATVERLRVQPKPLLAGWSDIARSLSAAGLLPADLASAREDALIDLTECEQLAQQPVSDPGWLIRWRQCWTRVDARPGLVDCASKWLAANVFHRAFAPTWRDVYEFAPATEALRVVGRKWLRAGPIDRPAWGFVFDGVARSVGPDPELVQLGLRWLAPELFGRNTWPFVWITLWDLRLAGEDQLIRGAETWLARTGARFQYAQVWCRLWDAGYSPAKLREWGRQYLPLAETPEDRASIEQRLAGMPSAGPSRDTGSAPPRAHAQPSF